MSQHRRRTDSSGSMTTTATIGLRILLQFLLSLLLLCFFCLNDISAFKQQSFRVVPQNTTVVLGHNTTVRCEVNDIIGYVQWMKDGIAMGDPFYQIAFPRTHMTVDRENGVYDLTITNATILEDGEYDCQVSRGPQKGSKEMRHMGRLTVLIPPKSVEIISQSSDNKTQEILGVKENDEFTIECEAKMSKPVTIIKWFRGNTEIYPAQRKDNVTEQLFIKRQFVRTLYNIRSRIKLNATLADDRMDYKCEAHHEALPEPLTSTIQTRILCGCSKNNEALKSQSASNVTFSTDQRNENSTNIPKDLKSED